MKAILQHRNIKTLIKLLIVGALLLVFAHQMEWHQFIEVLKGTRLELVGFALMVEWVFFAVESFRIRELAGRLFSWGLIFKSRILSLFINTILPGLLSGEIVRVMLLSQKIKGKKLYTLNLLLINRLYGLLALTVVYGIGYLIYSPSNIPLLPTEIAHLAFFGGAIAIFLPLWFSWRPFRRVLAPAIAGLKGRFSRILKTVYLATVQFSTPRRWLIGISTSTVTNFLAVGQVYLLSLAIGIDDGWVFWSVVLPLIAIASFIPLGFGAVGSQDAAMLLVANALGKPAEGYIAISVLLHLTRVLGCVPGVFYMGQVTTMLKDLRRRA